MMVMTARVNFKKIMVILAAAAAVILALILLLGNGNGETAATAAPTVSDNEGRIRFLKQFGWDVATSPTESSQVRIPQETSEVFDRYNTLQKGQGYDLSAYAGKQAMRYVYQIHNYPGANAPVYATLLVHKNQVIGGDVTDTAPGGKIRGFKMPEGTTPTTTATAETAETKPQ